MSCCSSRRCSLWRSVCLVLFFWLFAVPRVFKPVMSLFLLVSATAAYFINEYGVVIDVEMIRNVFLTNTAEAADLITFKLFWYVLLLGGLPTVLLWACTIAYRPLGQELWFRTKTTAALVPSSSSLPFPSRRTSHRCFASSASCSTC